MKKVLAIACFGAFALVSCKKDYTCDCTYEDGLGNEQTITYDYNDAKKDDAESSCDTAESNLNNGSCELSQK